MMNDDIRSTLSQASYTQQWFDLYTWLLPFAKRWVWDAGVPLWQGQQQDIAEDIAQEAVVRTFHQYQLSITGKAPAIIMLKPFSKTIARNYFQDRRRKDQRITRLFSPQTINEASLDNPEQIATEHLVQQSTLRLAARIIVTLPPGQKEALLKDLARSPRSEEQAGALEQALSETGIQLSCYQHQPVNNPTERKREAALRYVAYKRLKKEMDLRNDV